MKKRLILPLILALGALVVIDSEAQTTGDYRTNGVGTAWGTAANWDRWSGAAWVAGVSYPGQAAPLGGTTVSIQSNHNMVVNLTPANAINALTFTANAANSSVSMNTGFSLTVTNAITFNNPSAGTRSQTLSVNDGSVTCGSIVMANTTDNTRINTVSVASNGTLTVNGAITTNGAANENFVTLAGTAILNIVGPFANGSGTFTVPSTSTVKWFGDDANFRNDVSYGNLIIEIPATAAASRTKTPTSALVVQGDFTAQSLHATNTISFDAASFSFQVNGITRLNARGRFTDSNGGGTNTFIGNVRLVASSIFLTTSITATGGVIFNGGIDNIGGSFSAGGATFNTNPQIISGTTALSFGNGVAITGVVIDYSNTGDLTITGTTTISGAGGFTDSNNSGINTFVGNVSLAGTSTFATTTVTTTGNLIFRGGVTNSGTSFSAGGATFDTNAQAISGTTATSFGNDIAITGVLLTYSNTNNLTVTGTTTISGAGGFTDSSNSGVDTFVGNVSLAGTSTFTTTAVTTTGNLIFRGGIANSGTSFTAGGATFAINDQIITGSTAMSFANVVTITGATVDITNNNTNTITLSNTGAATLTGTAGASWIQGPNSTLSYAGSSITNITLSAATNIPNTVNYTGVTPTIFPASYNNLTYSGTTTATIATGTTVNISGNLTASSGTFTSAGTSTVVFNGTATQTTSGAGAFSFANVTLAASGAFHVNVDRNISISGVLNFTAASARRLVLGSGIDLSFGATATTSNADTDSYIVTDGTSSATNVVTKTSGNNLIDWVFTFPIGTVTGGYTPVAIPTVSVAPAASSTLSVKSIYTASVPGLLRRTFRLTIVGNINATTFSNGVFTYNNTTDISTGDTEADYTSVWRLTSGSYTSIATIAPPVNQFTVVGGSAATASLSTGTYEYSIGENPTVWYSYQSGNYNDPDVWTLDPSGSTLDNPFNTTPDNFDEINILNGFSVTVNVSNTLLNSTTIEAGGTLDMSSTTGHNLGTITGAGILRINGVTLPTATYTAFVATTGGTIEYYNTGGNLSTSQTTYNNLMMTNSSGSITYTLVGNMTVNGTFNLSTTAGTVTWQINDASDNQRTITLNGDLNVASGGRIRVGTGNEGNNAHILTMYGNITNNGSIKFYDNADAELDEAFYGPSYPVPATDIFRNELQGNAVAVTFSGSTDKTVTCNNTTDFYRFIVNKGTGQQAILTVNSSNTSYFRLFGPANIATTELANIWESVSANALSIVNGTLQLTGSINIPQLCINDASTTGYFPIPRNGALWLNGANVTVQISDNAPAVFASLKDGRILMSGLLRITNGTLNDGFSKGLGSQDGGSYLQEGGTVNCWQFRPRVGGSNIFSFNQTGGTLNVGYGYALFGGKIDQYEEDYCRFDLNNANSTFQMSGNAILNLAKPTNDNNGDGGLFRVGSSLANYNVTGGTINLYTGEETTGNSYPGYVNSTVPFYNLNIFEESVTTQNTQLQTNSIVVLNDLTINTGNTPSFVTNNLNVTVGGNFTINSLTTYTPGTGTTTFNGTGAQIWTHTATSTITGLTNVIMNKASGTLTMAGTGVLPNITGSRVLTSGTLADGGKIITVSGAGTLSNSATHTGTGSIDYTSTAATIGGSGGTFSNLNINSATATIATSGPLTIGTLRLIGTNSLNIGSNALTVTGNIYSDASPGIAVAFGATKRIQTIGFHNAGGLTRTAAANVPLLFPVGSGTLYTPNTITVNNATTYGTITVRPVNAEHPNVTTVNTSLLYYWRVTSTGFVTTGSTTISHSSYDFSTTTKNGTAATYRAARYDRSTNTWAAYGTNTAMTTAILPSPFNTGDAVAGHWPAGLGDQLDGEYTCGNIGAFGVVVAYYSKGSGAWNAATGVWTASSTHVGADLAGPPCTTCPVIIGDGAAINHSITVDANNRSCGTLGLNTGSTVDCGIFTDLNFGTTAGGAVTGGGLLRIGSPNYPAGDFTNFIGSNGGTVEWYLTSATSLGLTGTLGASSTNTFVAAAGTYTNIPQASSSGSGTGARFTVVIGPANAITSVTVTQAGSNYVAGNTVTINGSALGGGSGTMTRSVVAGNISYIVPAAGPSPQNLSLATYYNLILNPANGFTINLPPTNLTIYNNWTQQTGTGTVTNNGARSFSINGNLTQASASPGTFSLTGSGNTTISVTGNTSISGTGIFSATGGTHTLTTTGGVTNNGTLNFNGGGTVALTFTGSNNVSFTGTGTGGTTLSTVIVNKGTSQTPTVLFDVLGTVTAGSGWLTLTNGTFNFNNTGPHTLVSTATTYTIPATTKLKVSAGTVNVLSNASNAADLLLNGALEVAGGTVNIAGGTSGNDIEYAAAGTPSIIVSSGALNVNGSIRRSTTTITGALVYNQTGGSVTVGGRSSDNTRGVFEIDANTGSSFTLTGAGSLTVQRQSGGTGYADVFINPVTSNVASTSTIAVGLNAATTQNNLRVNIASSVGNFTVVGGTNVQTVNLFSNPMILGGNLTVTSPSVLVTNSLDVTIAGDLNITGTGFYTGGTNTTTFNGTGPQSALVTSGSTFNNLTVNKTAGTTLTLSGSSPDLNNLNILSGILSVGSALQVSGDITNNSSQVGAGSIVVFGAATTHNIYSSNGVFTNLTLGGAASSKIVNVTGNMVINGVLNFSTTSRYLMIKSHQLTFGNASSVTGAVTTAFIRTNGVSSDLGVTKIFPVGASSFTYPVGALFSYTPVAYSLTTASGGEGPLTVIPVNSRHLTAISPGEQILNYYWIVTRGAALNATVSASHTYTYLASLMGGSGGTLAAGYLDISNPTGWITSAHGGSAVTPLMTFTSTPTTNFPVAGNTYHYSVGTSASLPNPLVPVYSRLADVAGVGDPATGGNWSNLNSWTTQSDGMGAAVLSAPSGQAVVILPGARINTNLTGRKAFVTTINGLLVIGNIGHNMGTISGTGTMRVATNTFPAGTYTNFVSAAGGTIEYVAPMAMSGRDTYNNLSIYSGSAGLVTMPATPVVPITVNGNITIPVGTTLGPGGNNPNMNVAGNWTNAGTFVGGATSNLAIAGILNNSGTYTLGTSTNLSLAGNLINSGTFNQTAGSVIFNGSGAQSTSGVVTFNNLTMNKTNNLTLGTTTNVNGALTMTAGNIISNAFGSTPLLVLGASATTSGASVASFVSGQIRKTMNSGSTFIFPTGSNSASRYRPVTISSTSAADTWNVSYVPNNPTTDGFPNATYNSANMRKVSQYEYWQVANGTGTTTAGLTLSFGAGSYGGSDVGVLASLKTARWNGSQWDIPPGGGTFSQSGTNVAGTVSVSFQNAFSPQTLATDDANSSLPIELLDFTAQLIDSSVELNWSTGSELNNDHFTIERASDVEYFEEVAKIKGKGTFNSKSIYSLIDDSPLPGISYYRLKQTDFDGIFSYSEVRKIENDDVKVQFRIYPNPIVNNKFNFELTGAEPGSEVPLEILNLQGSSVFEASYKADQSGCIKTSVELTPVSSGMYIVIVNAATGLRKKIVIP